MRKNEHPRCGCSACRRGAASNAGKAAHKAVNRRIRHLTRIRLRTVAPEDFVSVVISTPFTD